MRSISKMFVLGAVACVLTAPFEAFTAPKPEKLPGVQFYRDLTLKLRTTGKFEVPMPDRSGAKISYALEFGEPIYPKPMINDAKLDMDNPKRIWRTFWDRIFLKDGSYLEVGGERVLLTCVFIQGQDNRANGIPSPLIPQIIMKVYIVANDYTCQGPIRPGWPETGGKKEAWDTYLHYEVRDPTIMLPSDGLIRYRWTEFPLVLLDEGPQS